MITLKPIHYALTAVILFATEVYIALFVDDAFIRPLFGDFLVVILIYCVLMSLAPFRVVPALLLVFVFAVMVELLQLTNLSSWASMNIGSWVRIVLGHQFSWLDIVMYAAGLLFTGAVEWVFQQTFRFKRNNLSTASK
ncbi:MAG: DUF2809 domain-containing protein [Leeuwenhoekiella sp.]